MSVTKNKHKYRKRPVSPADPAVDAEAAAAAMRVLIELAADHNGSTYQVDPWPNLT